MIRDLMAVLREAFDLSACEETAFEANPTDAPRYGVFRALGFGRISIGAQSLDDRELAWLGRDHDAAGVREAVRAARAAGFPSLGLDLIYGLPGQTPEGWERTLEGALALGPEHVSVYALTLTGGKRLPGPPLPSEGWQAEMAAAAMDRLEAAGIVQYEISNFARAGHESRHNLAYWTFRPYLGLGPSAHSYLAPRRFSNVAQTPEYVERVLAGKPATGMEETLTQPQVDLERLFLGLRLSEGVEASRVPAGEAEALRREGFLSLQGGRVFLTRQGRPVADAVIGRLVGAGVR